MRSLCKIIISLQEQQRLRGEDIPFLLYPERFYRSGWKTRHVNESVLNRFKKLLNEFLCHKKYSLAKAILFVYLPEERNDVATSIEAKITFNPTDVIG